MSAFETLFGPARTLLTGRFGSSVTYDDGVAAPRAVTAIVGGVAEDLLELDGDNRQLFRHRPVTVTLADVPAPQRTHKFTIDGEIWTVHERLPQDGGFARLVVVRPQRAEGGGRGMSR